LTNFRLDKFPKWAVVTHMHFVLHNLCGKKNVWYIFDYVQHIKVKSSLLNYHVPEKVLLHDSMTSNIASQMSMQMYFNKVVQDTEKKENRIHFQTVSHLHNTTK